LIPEFLDALLMQPNVGLAPKYATVQNKIKLY